MIIISYLPLRFQFNKFLGAISILYAQHRKDADNQMRIEKKMEKKAQQAAIDAPLAKKVILLMTSFF